jgi:hypothetical protein
VASSVKVESAPKSTPTSVEQNYAEFDRQASLKLTPNQAAILKKIGECESGFRMVPNKGGHSSAYGIFQELKVHDARAKRLGGTRFDMPTNIAVAIDLFLEQGTTPWNASRKCWS